MKQTVLLFKALGDPVRLRIVKLLEGSELCVCQLTAALGMGQSRISRHLAVLKAAGVIEDKREGKWVHYRICQPLRQAIDERLARLNQDDQMIKDKRTAAKTKDMVECYLEDKRKSKGKKPCQSI